MHQSVLAAEVVASLDPRPGGVFADGTAGSGGHAAMLAERIGPQGRILVIDRDLDALKRARERLRTYGAVCVFVHGNYGDLSAHAAACGFAALDGVLLDLGVSSDQLDTPERGFSFRADGPLDMRMDASNGPTAADLLNSASEEELAKWFVCYGEEPLARRIARAIVAARKAAALTRTADLASVVARAKGGRRGRIDPATQVFQALRIVVNGELDALDRGLEAGLNLLKPGGRLAVISFHSLEDRRVKGCFRRHAGRWEALEAGGENWIGEQPAVAVLTRKPVMAGETEVADNPRARSAKLRVAVRRE
ncbi:MAG: 16S rRNA (cytosine(1402)-N(4))-methyltransferase RsmH [bacterium]